MTSFLHELVEDSALRDPDGTCLVADGKRWTNAEFALEVARISMALENATQLGDRILVVADNRPEVAALLYAAPRAGLVLVFANIRHTAGELAQLIEATTPTLLIGTSHFIEVLSESIHEFSGVINLDDTDPFGVASAPAGPPRVVDPDACAWLIHTSGSTGRPKGVMLTHKSLLAGVRNTATARPLTDEDIYLFCFPLFHVAAYNVLVAHFRTRPVVLLRRFDVSEVAVALRTEQVTVASFAPTMISALLDEIGPEPLRSLRQISYGASAMPLSVLQRCLTELPECGLAQGYGMTELSGNAVFMDAEAHRRAGTDSPELLGAAGKAGPLIRVAIVNDTDHSVPTGQVGDIVVSGEQVTPGYWNDDAATAASKFVDHDGVVWFRTGDVGRIDAEGFLYIVDRLKDLVITGGENVSSREVEDLLGTHPEVAAVAVIGLPDERWGERLCAVVVPQYESADELAATDFAERVIAWSSGRIAGFKRPRTVFLVNSLPLNASGKVDKPLLREQFASQ